MLERLADEVVYLALRHLTPLDLASTCSVCHLWNGTGLGARDEVWSLLTTALLVDGPEKEEPGAGGAARGAKKTQTKKKTLPLRLPLPLPLSPSVRRGRRSRLSGRAVFAKAVRSRREHAEELRMRYDAQAKPSLRSLRQLLTRWAPLDMDHRGSAGCTLVHTVIADSRLTPAATLRCVRELVDVHGADAALGNDRDFSPLMSAAALGDARTVEFLLDRGADARGRGSHPNGFCGTVARPGQAPRTALEWAEAFGQVRCVAILEAHAVQSASTSSSSHEETTTTAPRDDDHHDAAAPGDDDGSVLLSPPRRRAKKRRRRPAEDVTYYCLETACAHRRANFGEMVACGTCANWFHCECVAMPPADFARYVRATDAHYTCPACASSATRITTTVDSEGPRLVVDRPDQLFDMVLLLPRDDDENATPPPTEPSATMTTTTTPATAAPQTKNSEGPPDDDFFADSNSN